MRKIVTGFLKCGKQGWECADPFFTENPGDWKSRLSRTILFENGKPLGPAHACRDLIKNHGKGCYIHLGPKLLFSTSDNSDPNANGRVYEVEVRSDHDEIVADVYWAPKVMHLNLTTACNLNCRICRPEGFTKKHKPNTLSREILERIVGDSFDKIDKLRLASSGELFLSPHLRFVLEEASQRKIPVFISTNGTMVTEEWAETLARSSVNEIQVSMDSPEKEMLEWIRCGGPKNTYEKLVQGAEYLAAARDKHGRADMRIGFHAAIMRMNMAHLPNLVRLAAEKRLNSVSLCFGYIHAYMDPEWSVFWERERYNQLVSESEKLAHDLDLRFEYSPLFDLNQPLQDCLQDRARSGDGVKHCAQLDSNIYIDPSGRVTPCCVSFFNVGSVAEQTISEIWHGERYHALRRTVTTNSPVNPDCEKCWIKLGSDPNFFGNYFHRQHWPQVEQRVAANRAS